MTDHRPSTAGSGVPDFTWPSCRHWAHGVCYECSVARGQALDAVARERSTLYHAARAVLDMKDRINARARCGEVALELMQELTAADEALRAIVDAMTPVYPAPR